MAEDESGESVCTVAHAPKRWLGSGNYGCILRSVDANFTYVTDIVILAIQLG